MSLGLYPSKYEYFDLVEEYAEIFSLPEEYKQDFSEYKGHLLDFFVSLDEDAVQTVRNVYTIWDVFGDIGGLIDMFKILA